MSRSQWLMMAAIGIVAMSAYIKSDRIAKRLGIDTGNNSPGIAI